MSEAYCNTCAHYFRGFCHRYPPVPITSRSTDLRAQTEWPTVSKGDWCGEHKPEPKPLQPNGSE